MKSLDFIWFDKKYKNGGTISIEDRVELQRQLGIRVSTKVAEQVKETLGELLTEFGSNREYSAGLDVAIQGLLFCWTTIIGMDREQYNSYLQRYKKAVQKHGSRTCFHCHEGNMCINPIQIQDRMGQY